MSRTVLLIDYDPRSIGRISHVLDGMSLRTLLALDGRAGVEEFRRSRPDLTLIQELLPKLHGFDACRTIKTTAEGGSRPVVLLSSQRNHSALVKTGCDAYLEKPFDDDALRDLIRHFL